MVEKIKLPDPDTFTREMLAKRWNCDLSLIDRYIKTKKLKEGIDTLEPKYNSLRPLRLRYFACDDAESVRQLVEVLNTKKKTWDEIINSNLSEKFRPCPRFLYLSCLGASDIEEAGLFDIVRNKMFLRELDDNYPDIFSFFCDLENTILIPVVKSSNFCCHLVVMKPYNFEDIIIPLEEVERFEDEDKDGNEPKRKGKNAPSVDIKHMDDVYEIITKELKLDPQKIPDPGIGKSGVAADLRKFCDHNKINLTKSQINKALRLLKKASRIKYIPDSK